MQFKEAIKTILKNKSMTQGDLAKLLGYKGVGSVSTQMTRGNITLATFCKMCDVLGYEVAIQPKSKPGARSKSQIIIEGAEEKKDVTSE